MGSRTRARTFPAVVGLVLALAAGTVAARAQVPPIVSSTTTSSTTAPPSTTSSTAAPTTSTTAAPSPTAPSVPSTATTTSTTAPGGDSGAATTTTAPGTVGGPGAGGGGDSPTAAGVVPPEFQAAIASIKRSGSNGTAKLLSALRPLEDLGLTQAEAIAAGFGRFPVGGLATYSHDWWFPRFVPTFHLHQGTDIFAATGTPVRSPADGTLRLSQGAVGGLAAYVTTADGTYFYMAHLSAFVPGQATGQQVKTGDVVGYVGDSGNAKGGAPHVHFEIHPAPTRTVTTGKGKKAVTKVVTSPVPPGTPLPPVDPKPYLDAWLAEALAGVPALIARSEAGRPRAIIATGLTRRIAESGGDVFSAPAGPPRSQLLWASSASPPGGALRLAEAEAAAAAREAGYASVAREEVARRVEWQQAEAAARAVLLPLTPVALRPFL